ncbi:MAG: transaldolase family protein, partial [Armatimonadota bacterium]|nr:transaldolase family protein [Armatimonadota bacterium]
MEFFLDTANLEEIRTAQSWGILDGVTTNPTLVAKEGRDHKALIQEICALVPGPVSVETTTADAEGMVREGEVFATWAP